MRFHMKHKRIKLHFNLDQGWRNGIDLKKYQILWKIFLMFQPQKPTSLHAQCWLKKQNKSSKSRGRVEITKVWNNYSHGRVCNVLYSHIVTTLAASIHSALKRNVNTIVVAVYLLPRLKTFPIQCMQKAQNVLCHTTKVFFLLVFFCVCGWMRCEEKEFPSAAT